MWHTALQRWEKFTVVHSFIHHTSLLQIYIHASQNSKTVVKYYLCLFYVLIIVVFMLLCASLTNNIYTINITVVSAGLPAVNTNNYGIPLVYLFSLASFSFFFFFFCIVVY